MVGLIIPANLKYSPYIKQYIECCNLNGIKYEIISWNKYGILEDADYAFQCPVQTSKHGFLYGVGRIFNWIRFATFAKEICYKKKYDKLILFTGQLGAFMAPYLKKYYPNKYILDIRDDSPIIHLLKHRFNLAVEFSSEVVISSPEFCFWRSGKKGWLSHNIDLEDIKKEVKIPPVRYSQMPIGIISMGDLLGFKINRQLLKSLGNDERFLFIYTGRENTEKEKLIQYVHNQGYNNVLFRGCYDKKDVYSIYRQDGNFVNIIREKNNFNQYALPNKLYEGTLAGLPLITLKGNMSLSRIIRQYSLGIVLDELPKEGLGDILEEEILYFNFEAYCQGRDEFLRLVVEDQMQFQQMLEAFIRK